MTKEILLLLACIICSLSITIPLTGTKPRCTISYTNDQSESLKLEVDFPVMNNQQQNESYLVSIYNTQTKLTQYDNVVNGKFKKQYALDENAIYRICFKAVTNRDIGTVNIEYLAQTKHNVNAMNFNIPTSLAKDQDLKQSYTLLQEIFQDMQQHKQSTKRKQDLEYQIYENFVSKNDKVITISYFEIGAIILIGIYQFFAIKKFLVDKKYM